MESPLVAIVGTGEMGRKIVMRVRPSGHRVRIWNRAQSRAADLNGQGVNPWESVAEAADGAEVVPVVVRDDNASRDVWAQILSTLGPSAVAVEMSTLSVDRACAIHQQVGNRLVEAPMIGSLPQVEAGQIQLLYAGTDQAMGLCPPVLKTCASEVHPTGGRGTAAGAELIVNGLHAAQLAAAGDLLEADEPAGLDLGRVLEILGDLHVFAPAVTRALARWQQEDSSSNFSLDLVEKDLCYLERLTAPSPVVSATRAVERSAIPAGRGTARHQEPARLINALTTWRIDHLRQVAAEETRP